MTNTSKHSISTTFLPEITPPDITGWEKEMPGLSGPIPYTLENDFLFKYSMQNNLYALKGLVSALLFLPLDSIVSIQVLNPIELGDKMEDKKYILDLKLLLNDHKLLNIEMQVAFQAFYPERALVYLCRTFVHLSAGDDYSKLLPCVQISIMDTTLFGKTDPRYTDAFYSEYVLKEKTTNQEYSDKFSLCVLSLNHLENADDKENPNGLYRWAKLFKATTWEEIKMVAQNNDYMKSVAFGLKKLTEDEKVQQDCEARYLDMLDRNTATAFGRIEGQKIGREEGREEMEAELRPIIEAKDSALSEKDAAISEMGTALSEKDAALSEKDAEIAALKKLLETQRI